MSEVENADGWRIMTSLVDILHDLMRQQSSAPSKEVV